ncbi:MAG: cytochrome C [Nitrospirae bacterium]|nr:cytochrome C [Nitrospirota bacterium]MBI3351325.1 cytochrome C [Nitrospirota bacterium]
MKKINLVTAVIVALCWVSFFPARGEETVQRKNAQGEVHREDLVRKEIKSIQAAVAKGEKLWFDRNLGTNGMSCNMCHPNAAATHPETFPKFKSQLGAVVSARQFINWCVVIPLQGNGFELGGAEITALEAYMVSQNKGQALEAGVPSP